MTPDPGIAYALANHPLNREPDIVTLLAAFDISSLLTVENLIALLTLTLLEIVLGIDNIVFISVLCGKLPPEQRDKARIVGLSLALITRLMLLGTISFLMGATKYTLFTLPFITETVHGPDGDVTGPIAINLRDLILILGGTFLIWKSTKEIHHKMEDHHEEGKKSKGVATFNSVIFQILIIDLVFSLDSVITAVGMAKSLAVMVTAVIISVCVMLAASGSINRFIDKHPTMKMLALSFLLLIGVVLVADGLHQHISKGYIYFAMAFSLVVEMLNLRTSRKSHAPSTPA